MAKLKVLQCPQCGSEDLAEVAWNKRKCEHCGGLAILEDDLQNLKVIEGVCPNCGFNNKREANHCGQCGTNLVKRCFGCNNEMPSDHIFCPKCGQNHQETEAVLSRLRTSAMDTAQSGKLDEEIGYLDQILGINPNDTWAAGRRRTSYLIQGVLDQSSQITQLFDEMTDELVWILLPATI